MTDEPAIVPDKRLPSPEELEEALQRVLDSDAFAGAQRLKTFLAYIVKETVAGRGRAIRGKTIAEDVYGRSPAGDGDSQNVVRVDAGRLRRRLNDYYAGAGRNDRLRIHVDAGGYVPRFEALDRSVGPTVPGAPASRRAIHTTVAVVVFAVAVIVLVFALYESSNDAVRHAQPTDPSKVAERQAVLEKSATALQAVNLANQARGLIFPIFDVERQHLATEMFRRVIALDNDYAGGYAGAAQTLATMALVARGGAERTAFLAEAGRMADRALAIAPSSAWTQSAAAWVAFAGRDYERATRLSAQARALAPEDGNVLDFFALIALFTGRFEDAREAADPKHKRGAQGHRLANRNIYAAANFHLGEYARTVEALETAAKLGEPLAAPTLVFLAAAYHAMGDDRMAGIKIEALTKAWPNVRVDGILRRFYRSSEDADALLGRLFSAGWKPPQG